MQPVLEGGEAFVIEKAKAGELQTAVDLPETLSAPVEAGQRLGEMTVTAGGETLLTVPIVAANGAEALGLPDIFLAFVRGLAGEAQKVPE